MLYVIKSHQASRSFFRRSGKIGPGYCSRHRQVHARFLPPAEAPPDPAFQAFFRRAQNITKIDILWRRTRNASGCGGFALREEHEVGCNCIAVRSSAKGGLDDRGLSVT